MTSSTIQVSSSKRPITYYSFIVHYSLIRYVLTKHILAAIIMHTKPQRVSGVSDDHLPQQLSLKSIGSAGETLPHSHWIKSWTAMCHWWKVVVSCGFNLGPTNMTVKDWPRMHSWMTSRYDLKSLAHGWAIESTTATSIEQFCLPEQRSSIYDVTSE